MQHLYKYLQYIFYLVLVRVKNAYVLLWTKYVQITDQNIYNIYWCKRSSQTGQLYSVFGQYLYIWKVGICYITYILCYVPPLLHNKTMQHI